METLSLWLVNGTGLWTIIFCVRPFKIGSSRRTFHTARETIEILRQFFRERAISHYYDINWWLRFSDLTRYQFFFTTGGGVPKEEDLYQQSRKIGATERERHEWNQGTEHLNTYSYHGTYFGKGRDAWSWKWRHLKYIAFHIKQRVVTKKNKWILFYIKFTILY